MPLPSQEDIDNILASDEEEDKEVDDGLGVQVARSSIRNAAAAGVIAPQPPLDMARFTLGQATQTQDTLIPTQESIDARNRNTMILSQLSSSQATTARGTEFDALMRRVQDKFPSQTQTVTERRQNFPRENNARNKKHGGSGKQGSTAGKPPFKGRSSGAKGYTEAERLNFLDIIERRLPCSGTEWSLVASEHGDMYPEMERTVDSIKRQYQSLLRRREPTGDPNCPADVKQAKAIDRLLKAKQRAGDISKENGGPIAALAGMEIQQDEDAGRFDSVSVNTSATGAAGAALVQKRSSPRNSGSAPSILDQLISMQMVQNQKEDQRRAEEREQAEKDRQEQREREEARRDREERERMEEREREERERKEQRRREERREQMLLGLVATSLAAFSGKTVDTRTLLRGRSDSSSDDSVGEHDKKRRKKGSPKDDKSYN